MQSLFFGLTNLSLGPYKSNGKAIVHTTAQPFTWALIWAVMEMEVFHLGTKMGRKIRKSELWRDLTDISVLGVPLEKKHQQRVQREKTWSCNGVLAVHSQGTPQEQESRHC